MRLTTVAIAPSLAGSLINMVLSRSARNIAIEQLAAPAAFEDEETDSARQIAAAPDIDFGQQRIYRLSPLCRDLAERLPERRLQRHARRVPGDPNGVLDQLRPAHPSVTMQIRGGFSSGCGGAGQTPTRRLKWHLQSARIAFATGGAVSAFISARNGGQVRVAVADA